jgi:hypothetical protein
MQHAQNMRNACNILVGELEGKRPLRRLNVVGNILLKWIFGKDGRTL